MKKSEQLTTSLEDYLEAILFLEEKNRVARVKDIAEFLSVQMPSVTGAQKNLRSKGLVEYERNSFINLSREGLKIARSIRKKHDILKNFLKSVLLLDDDQSEEEACKIEHAISQNTALRIKNLTDYVLKGLDTGELSGQSWQDIISE
ncbi:metal-dependent transcriptional regulator [Spirochaeta isovalerica]|uniref:Transcriptional regulator MntR n=1 Tax=Spirochaeta isovalerica TaxID=150 RepID=A0A841R6G3_9SPIO|nr:metal-dependent transcriptional regulator [Spirochaeta isovalerica]MBB6478589.1 DtxR family Mn-dependent transcriptional regulator [Spirochaeta isovalerica]